MKREIIETPMSTVAKHVSYDTEGNPVYFDGVEYWVVLKNGRIKYHKEGKI